MSDSEFLKLEKAEQEVLAQIAKQRKICDDLRADSQATQESFLTSYGVIFRPLEASLMKLEGDSWSSHRSALKNAVGRCGPSFNEVRTSQDIANLHTSLKSSIKQALEATDSTVNQFQEMSASLRRLDAIVLGRDTPDILEELQAKKQRLEKEEERLKGLQARYDRYFGERNPKKN
ncbi:MAG: hypothetical protein HY247_05540 [archaeon]|nr:MAG: hypothetical protein HY247_05540 [archaeon]